MIHPPHELRTMVEGFAVPRILVVGDLILDQYVYGDAERLSPEAPVPVVRERYREYRVGGAGNVALFLATLGAKPTVVGVCGDDDSGRRVGQLLTKAGVATSGLVAVNNRPTSTKTRVVGLAQHRHQQQMLRLDHEVSDPIGESLQSRVLEIIDVELSAHDIVCVEDYNKGLFSGDMCQLIIRMARDRGVEVLVDPAAVSDYSRYFNASVITPNRAEAQLASGKKMRSASDAPAVAAQLRNQLKLDACVLTLDRDGMYLLEGGSSGKLHPTRPRTVYDVTGAGDMVLAMLTMARAAKIPWSAAVDLGNIAGGLEVERFGCVPVTKAEIIAELARLEGGGNSKIRTAAELSGELQSRKKAGERICFTNGVFDILHAGHVPYLQFAPAQADILVVGVNTDASVRRLKGNSRPVNALADRLAVLAGLASVDFLVSFDDDTPLELIKGISPDVLVKGSDYADKNVVGREWVESGGGHVVLAPFLPGRSTSRMIEKVAEKSPT